MMIAPSDDIKIELVTHTLQMIPFIAIAYSLISLHNNIIIIMCVSVYSVLLRM